MLPWPEAFDELGFPLHHDGASTVIPGLHFVGVHFMRKRKSATLVGAGEDAAIVARNITEPAAPRRRLAPVNLGRCEDGRRRERRRIRARGDGPPLRAGRGDAEAGRRSSGIPGRGSSSGAGGTATRTSRAGRRGWAPLLYVCHSCFGSAAAARELLERGADPNGSFVNEYGRMSALYGAAGVRYDPELTRAAARGGGQPRRRGIALPRDRGGEHRMPAAPARARGGNRRHERARARTRRRAARARPAAARPRRRPERRSDPRPRRAAWAQP